MSHLSRLAKPMATVCLALSLATFLTGPAAKADEATFQAFGGKAGLQSLMEDFMTNLLADPRTRPFFEKANQTRVKAQLVDQFCQALGGPCQYKGLDMKSAHQGLPSITREHFNALVEDLQDAMDKHKVPFSAQNKLLAELAPLHRDIEH
ncbi:group I truncated hemoglobin [Nitrospirillum pindoramense]|uniref:Hemoglobin n=1 Tax=Nitrospirillum amazonense TaxID=28077 RepID=A0A560GXB5_9PROT|nr:group 1 truncated hemoglobin [Nitrospirillum amazonense]TWB38070.1 hemoglobin [Nitrospirillum amazonense]